MVSLSSDNRAGQPCHMSVNRKASSTSMGDSQEPSMTHGPDRGSLYVVYIAVMCIISSIPILRRSACFHAARS